MGEKIRILSQGKILGTQFEIELNKPHAPHMPREVHVQSENFRYMFDEREFTRLALKVLCARRHLVKLKGLEKDG